MVDTHQQPGKQWGGVGQQWHVNIWKSGGMATLEWQPTHPQQPRRAQPQLHIDTGHRETWQWARALAATPCDATINRTPHSRWQPSHSRQHRCHDSALHGNKHKRTASI